MDASLKEKIKSFDRLMSKACIAPEEVDLDLINSLNMDSVAKDKKGIWPISQKISKLPEGEEEEQDEVEQEDAKRRKKARHQTIAAVPADVDMVQKLMSEVSLS